MEKTLTVLLLSAASLFAQANGSTGSTVPKPAKTAAKKTAAAKPAAAAVQTLTIPRDAVANGNGTFSWTDKRGRKWTYAQTPFGVMRAETTAVPAATSASLAGVKMFDDGDKVRFETPTPFGVMKGEKNKADLTDEERALYNSQNPSPIAGQE